MRRTGKNDGAAIWRRYGHTRSGSGNAGTAAKPLYYLGGNNARLESIPEPEPVPYQKNDEKWERFGILLSGIVSTLNDHDLYRMDVEEHTPVMEQKVVSLVRRSWGSMAAAICWI